MGIDDLRKLTDLNGKLDYMAHKLPQFFNPLDSKDLSRMRVFLMVDESTPSERTYVLTPENLQTNFKKIYLTILRSLLNTATGIEIELKDKYDFDIDTDNAKVLDRLDGKLAKAELEEQSEGNPLNENHKI